MLYADDLLILGDSATWKKELNPELELNEDGEVKLQFVNKAARVFHVIDSKPVYMPVQAGTEQSVNMTTQPDFAVSVNVLTQYGRKSPSELLRKAASSFRLKYHSLSPRVRLNLNVDSSFANRVDRKRICGFTVKLKESLITWKTSYQHGVVTLTAYAVATTKWLHNILKVTCQHLLKWPYTKKSKV